MRSRVLVVDDKENMLKLFAKILGELLSPAQMERVGEALAPLIAAV